MKQISIPMKAEAAVKHDRAPYTGTNGVYASLKLSEAYRNKVISIAEELDISVDPEKLHTTVIYSKAGVIPVDKLPTGYGENMMFGAVCNEVSHWVGHKGQTCVVLKLISLDIVRLNAGLQSAGAIHTFTPYAPHITLSDEHDPIDDAFQARIDALNKKLAADPLELTFDHYHVGDLV